MELLLFVCVYLYIQPIYKSLFLDLSWCTWHSVLPTLNSLSPNKTSSQSYVLTYSEFSHLDSFLLPSKKKKKKKDLHTQRHYTSTKSTTFELYWISVKSPTPLTPEPPYLFPYINTLLYIWLAVIYSWDVLHNTLYSPFTGLYFIVTDFIKFHQNRACLLHTHKRDHYWKGFSDSTYV